MQAITANVNRMVEYLSHALAFEKFVYIWSNSMENANARMGSIYQARQQMETRTAEITQAQRQLQAQLLQKDNLAQLRLQQQAERFEKKAKGALIFLTTALILTTMLGAGFGFVICSTADRLTVPPVMAIIIFALIFPLFLLPVLLICCLPPRIHRRFCTAC